MSAGGELCLNSLTAIFNILFEGKMPEGWMLSCWYEFLKGREISLVRTRTRE